mmetsp:Transcript_13553/g.40509  ORF Transcript_13553/g.40509 Transcript_13553/m.40509 type:complete len:205 (-) Transcript_13553:364-978(-)
MCMQEQGRSNARRRPSQAEQPFQPHEPHVDGGIDHDEPGIGHLAVQAHPAAYAADGQVAQELLVRAPVYGRLARARPEQQLAAGHAADQVCKRVHPAGLRGADRGSEDHAATAGVLWRADRGHRIAVLLRVGLARLNPRRPAQAEVDPRTRGLHCGEDGLGRQGARLPAAARPRHDVGIDPDRLLVVGQRLPPLGDHGQAELQR